MGPWHHVGATMESTLDKNWMVRAIRWELNPKINKQVLEQNKYKIPELSTKSINKEIHEYMKEPE